MIANDHPKAPDPTCAYTMIFYKMGFHGDACHYRPSLLCPDDALIGVPRGDRLLLRAPHDPSLVDGMECAVAMLIARAVFDEVYREEPDGGRKIAASGATPTLGQVLRLFEAIVFLEDSFASYKEAWIRKWLKPIGVCVSSEPPGVGDLFFGDVERVLSQLRDAARISIELAHLGEPENFDIVFANRDTYVNSWLDIGMPLQGAMLRAATIPCSGTIVSRSRFAVAEYAAMYIGVFAPEHLIRHCVLEEIYNALGPIKDACRFRPSIVCEDDHELELSLRDRVILRTLYDRQVWFGERPADVMPVVR